MLEWKARILLLLITVGTILEQLGIHVENNWNW
jgi:hypothetical protein